MDSNKESRAERISLQETMHESTKIPTWTKTKFKVLFIIHTPFSMVMNMPREEIIPRRMYQIPDYSM